MEKAVIFSIMHYSIHDGPGIRTTVFFKGCPLSCKWCHNPESQDIKPVLVTDPGKCIKCGHCSSCPTGARETIGYELTVSGLMQEIAKDRLFYDQSGGGVTFSGGEPFFQGKFLLEALAKCREEFLNTAIDTSGYCSTEAILEAALIADYFLYDIKFIDSKKHEKFCGAPNSLILKNLQCLAKTRTKILIRIPVIPGINDDMSEMEGIFNFIKDLDNIETVYLLPYHNIHSRKYEKIGRQYELAGIPAGRSPNMGKIKNLFAAKFRTAEAGQNE